MTPEQLATAAAGLDINQRDVLIMLAARTQRMPRTRRSAIADALTALAGTDYVMASGVANDEIAYSLTPAGVELAAYIRGV